MGRRRKRAVEAEAEAAWRDDPPPSPPRDDEKERSKSAASSPRSPSPGPPSAPPEVAQQPPRAERELSISLHDLIVRQGQARSHLADLNGFTSSSGELSALDQARVQRAIEDALLGELDKGSDTPFRLGDAVPLLREGAKVVHRDDFTKCFESAQAEPWNWNWYLAALWVVGLALRYLVVFPLRCLALLLGFLAFAAAFEAVTHGVRDAARRARWQRALVRFLCSVFVFSWTGVVRYRGVVPARRPNQIYVANHSSMIDMVVLSQHTSFAVVGQSHPGWVGYIQSHYLECLGCVWFNRSESKDRSESARRIREYISRPDSSRLLIFPEGTCVNNRYVVQFKKGAFDMGAEICPISIKYNPIFVDGYWNSRAKSFAMHLVDLMTSWAVVCDVRFLEPQRLAPGESAIDFAKRVQLMIAESAGIVPVDWDGYMKYFRPSTRYVQLYQRIFAARVERRFLQEEAEAEAEAEAEM